MQTTILSFANIHLHGNLFANFMRERHKVFIQEKQWPMPSDQQMEFDQYDTPQSRWVVLHEAGSDVVLGGFRLTPTTAQCGIYSYMIRDAKKGLLDSIPASLIDDAAPQEDDMWECSRAFLTEHVVIKQRGPARRALIKAFLPAVEHVGGKKLITLTNVSWGRWMPMHGISGIALGPAVNIDDEPHQTVVMSRPA